MKKLSYILFLAFTIHHSLFTSGQIGINDGTTKIHINSGGNTLNINPYFRQGTAQDNGYYNGFPMISDVVDKQAWGVYKNSFTHGGGGALMLIHTNYWGDVWTEDSITVDGTVIHSTNHSFYRYEDGFMVICYKLVGDSALRFAVNDDDDSLFTSIATVITPSFGYSIAPSPIKMVETSYGTLLFVYYSVGSGGNPNSSVIMESEDDGLSFTQKCVVYTATDTYPTGFPASRGNEIAICETHPTGIEATSKWIAMIRPEVSLEGSGYYMVYRSTDGANTWSQDLTQYAGSFTDDNGATVTSGTFTKSGLYLFLNSNSPVDMKLIGDSVFVVNGNRNGTHGYGLVYLTATADSAFSNRITSWTRHPYVEAYYDGSNPGSSTDYGYPVLFKSGANVFVAEYTVSSFSPLPGVTRRCKVYTKKIK